jgi:hypothetical protein
MTERDWQNPATQDPAAADAVEDGSPTPGRSRKWAARAPGTPEWREAGNDEARRGDREREIEATGDGQHGTAPRDFGADEVSGSETSDG